MCIYYIYYEYNTLVFYMHLKILDVLYSIQNCTKIIDRDLVTISQLYNKYNHFELYYP